MSPDPTSLFGGGGWVPNYIVALVTVVDRSDVWKHFDRPAVTEKMRAHVCPTNIHPNRETVFQRQVR